MKIIIAGNYHQYKDYLREHNLPPWTAVHLYSVKQLMGLHGCDCEIIRTGEWWENPCIDTPELGLFEHENNKIQ